MELPVRTLLHPIPDVQADHSAVAAIVWEVAVPVVPVLVAAVAVAVVADNYQLVIFRL